MQVDLCKFIFYMENIQKVPLLLNLRDSSDRCESFKEIKFKTEFSFWRYAVFRKDFYCFWKMAFRK